MTLIVMNEWRVRKMRKRRETEQMGTGPIRELVPIVPYLCSPCSLTVPTVRSFLLCGVREK